MIIKKTVKVELNSTDIEMLHATAGIFDNVCAASEGDCDVCPFKDYCATNGACSIGYTLRAMIRDLSPR